MALKFICFLYFVLQIKRSTYTNTIAGTPEGEYIMMPAFIKTLSAILTLCMNGHVVEV